MAESKPAAGEGVPTGFYVMVTGQLEGGVVSGHDNLYCDFSFTHGPDWTKMDGLDAGITQISKTDAHGSSAVWNMPLEIVYRTTNVFGWPRVVLAVYALDSLGRNLAVGYGAAQVPCVPGRHRRMVRLFAPVSSTPLQGFVAWLTGNRPEYWDPRFVAQGRGREVTRVKSTGKVWVSFNVVTRGMTAHGFSTGAEVDSVSTALPLAGPASTAAAAAAAAAGGTALGGALPVGAAGVPRSDSGLAAVYRGLYRQGSGIPPVSSAPDSGMAPSPSASGGRFVGASGVSPAPTIIETTYPPSRRSIDDATALAAASGGGSGGGGSAAAAAGIGLTAARRSVGAGPLPSIPSTVPDPMPSTEPRREIPAVPSDGEDDF